MKMLDRVPQGIDAELPGGKAGDAMGEASGQASGVEREVKAQQDMWSTPWRIVERGRTRARQGDIRRITTGRSSDGGNARFEIIVSACGRKVWVNTSEDGSQSVGSRR